MTVYRQRALAYAVALQDSSRGTRDLRRLVSDAPTILLRNVYGWFERETRGVYRLTLSGREALLRWVPAVAKQEHLASHVYPLPVEDKRRRAS